MSKRLVDQLVTSSIQLRASSPRKRRVIWLVYDIIRCILGPRCIACANHTSELYFHRLNTADSLALSSPAGITRLRALKSRVQLRPFIRLSEVAFYPLMKWSLVLHGAIGTKHPSTLAEFQQCLGPARRRHVPAPGDQHVLARWSPSLARVGRPAPGGQHTRWYPARAQ